MSEQIVALAAVKAIAAAFTGIPFRLSVVEHAPDGIWLIDDPEIAGGLLMFARSREFDARIAVNLAAAYRPEGA